MEFSVPSPKGRGAGGEGLALDYIHRRDNGTDIYFVRNCGDKPVTADASFRVVGRRPELWNPVDGTVRELPEYRTEAKQTVVPLEFEPYGSWFVVFRKKNNGPHDTARSSSLKKGATAGLSSSAGNKSSANTAGQASSDTQHKNFQKFKPLKTLDGQWRVSFDPRWGGPENVTFDKLVDWTARPEEGIKHYSGTAVYRKTFELLPETVSRKKLYLDLGIVKELARVKLNGRDLGVVWCPPWRVDISAAVRSV